MQFVNLIQGVFWVSVCMVVYVYFGYPLIIVALSYAKKHPIKKKEITPEVALLIAAFNEEKVIEKKIQNSLELNYDKNKLKIIIASDGSTDGTAEIAKRYEAQGVILYNYSERRGKIAALNETMEHIHTEIVVFSDANTMYHQDAIKHLVRNFYDESVGVVSGNVTLEGANVCFNEAEKLYWNYEHIIQLRETLCFTMLEADGAMYAIRRKLFIPPPNNTILDDSVIPMLIAKQGYRIVYEPEALGAEDTSPNLKAEFTRKIRITAGGVQAIKQKIGVPGLKNRLLLFQYVSHKLLRWILPYFMILAFISSCFLLNYRFYQIALALQIAFYTLALIGLFYSKIRDNKLIATVVYFCTVNVASAIGIVLGLLNKQKVTWKTFQRS